MVSQLCGVGRATVCRCDLSPVHSGVEVVDKVHKRSTSSLRLFIDFDFDASVNGTLRYGRATSQSQPWVSCSHLFLCHQFCTNKLGRYRLVVKDKIMVPLPITFDVRSMAANRKTERASHLRPQVKRSVFYQTKTYVLINVFISLIRIIP